MKAHKYWSLGALAHGGCFYTGCKKLMQGSQVFRLWLSGLHGHGNLLWS